MTNGSGTWTNNQPPAAAEKLWRGLVWWSLPHRGTLHQRHLPDDGQQQPGWHSRQIPRPQAHQPEQNADEPLLQQGFFIGPLGPKEHPSNQTETQRSRTEHNCSLLREIAQH